MEHELVNRSHERAFRLPEQLGQCLSERLATDSTALGRDDASSGEIRRACVLTIPVDEVGKVEGFAFGSIDRGDVCEL